MKRDIILWLQTVVFFRWM